VAAASRDATEHLHSLLGGGHLPTSLPADGERDVNVSQAFKAVSSAVRTSVKLGRCGWAPEVPGVFSAQDSRQHSQWDNFFTLQGVSPSKGNGVSHVVSQCILDEKPLEPGFDGGGGVLIGLMSLHKMDEVRAVIVIAGAARRWMSWRDRVMV